MNYNKRLSQNLLKKEASLLAKWNEINEDPKVLSHDNRETKGNVIDGEEEEY